MDYTLGITDGDSSMFEIVQHRWGGHSNCRRSKAGDCVRVEISEIEGTWCKWIMTKCYLASSYVSDVWEEGWGRGPHVAFIKLEA